MINQKNRESGMALVFAVGLLALLLAVGIAFVGNSVNSRRAAENNSARTQSRMLAMSAINRAVASLMVYTHSYALANDADFPQHYRNIYSYTSSTAFTDALKDKSKSSQSLMRLPSDSSVVGEQVAMRHNAPFESGKWKGNWVFFRDGKGETNDRIIGRAAWQVIGSSAQILAPVFFRGGVKEIDPVDNNFKANENRWGREIDEVYLTDTFTTLANQLGEGADSRVTGYETIYNALNTGDNLQKQRWAEKWFFPDPSDNSTVGDPSMVLGENFSSIYNGHGVSLMRFNISELWQGQYSETPGGTSVYDSWQKAYEVGDNADQWYARLGIDTTKSADLEKTNSELAITRLTADAQMMEGTFDYKIVTTATAEDDYSGLPYLRRIGTDKGTFADLATLRKQIAANFNDYCDADDVPTSDIPAKDWMKAIDDSYKHPTYTGNEKTPYLYELGMILTMVNSAGKNGIDVTLDSTTKIPSFSTSFRALPIVKLCNMYPLSAGDKEYKADIDFGEVKTEFKIKKVKFPKVKFLYQLADSSVKDFESDVVVDLNTFTDSGSSVIKHLNNPLVAQISGNKLVVESGAEAIAEFGAMDNTPYPVAYPVNKWKKPELAGDMSVGRSDGADFGAITIGDNILSLAGVEAVKPDDFVASGTGATPVTSVTFDKMEVQSIEVVKVTVVPHRAVLSKKVDGTDTGMDYAAFERIVDGVQRTFEWSDFDPVTGGVQNNLEFTFADTLDGIILGGIRTEDPRQNLNPSDWDMDNEARAVFASDLGNKTNYDSDIAKVMDIDSNGSGKANTFIRTDKKVSPKNPVTVTSDPDDAMDWETVTEPAYKDDSKHISTAIIRNAPMMSPWEIGFIHRGVKWQTINLKNAGVTTFDDNRTAWDKTTRSSSYAAGDGGILEQIKMTDQVRTYGKINVNVLRPKHQDYCPEDIDIARVLFRNLRYGEDPWIFLKNSTRQTNGTFPTAEDSGTVFKFSGDNSLAETAATNFVADVNRGTFSNRAAFLEYTHNNNALENAFGAVTVQETDASQEEIIGKTINLLDASYSSPSIINVLVVAQSIRDREGTQVAVAADKKAKYTSPDGSTVSDFEDGIATKSCSIGKFDLYEHSENDDKNIYFDEITGEVKMFVTFERDQTTGRMRVLKVTYL